MSRRIYIPDPVNAQHADNAGLNVWLAGIPPLDGGKYLYDIAPANRTATLTANPNWVAGPTQGQRAVSFNGTTQCGSVPLDLSGTSKITLSFWLWQDAFDGSDGLCMEFTANQNANDGGFYLDPNSSSFAGRFEVKTGRDTGLQAHFARPSAAAWHHYALGMDCTVASNSTIPVIYVDGVAVSLTYSGGSGGRIGAFANDTLNIMCRNSASLFNAGRMTGLRIVPRLLDAGTAAQYYQWANAPLTDPRFNRVESRRSIRATAAAAASPTLLLNGWGAGF